MFKRIKKLFQRKSPAVAPQRSSASFTEPPKVSQRVWPTSSPRRCIQHSQEQLAPIAYGMASAIIPEAYSTADSSGSSNTDCSPSYENSYSCDSSSSSSSSD